LGNKDLMSDMKTFDVVCPHCSKPFASELLAGAAERYRGFKCPHCKLFVPAKRVGDTARVSA
jgi:DNA-directed RNA polymerase subunit RPC12/RpoP